MATELKTVVVSNPVADFKRRAASAQEIARATILLRDKIARVRGLGLIVLLEFGDGAQHRVDCDAGVVDAEEANADCTIAIPAADFIQIVGGGIDPRFLIFFQRMKMTGSPKAVTKFLDAIGARQVVGTLRTDRELPKPTTDYALAKSQIREFGYCFIADALGPQRLRALKTRLEEQAAAEREIGYATRGTATKTGVPLIQPVWNLVNKGQVFLDLFDHPIIDEFCIEFLGEYFQVSSYTSKIAHPGCKPQVIHTDQLGVSPPLPHVNVGLNIFYFLDDFTDRNGATRIVPGSHLPENRVAPDDIFSIDGTIAAEAPAGSALIFDTRLWHGTGPNRTNRDRRAIFMVMMRSWMRSIENHTLSVRPEVLAKMSERVKIMHGFRTTGAAGGVDGPVEGEIVGRDFDSRMRELYPRQPIAPD